MSILTAAGTAAFEAYAERREALNKAIDDAKAALVAARRGAAHLTPEGRWEVVKPFREAWDAANLAHTANDEAFEAEGASAKAGGVAWLESCDE